MDLDGKDLFGWELNNPDHNVFDLEILEVWGGCRNCEQVLGCTAPCESVRRLVPRDGTIIGLGREKEKDKPRMSYFALLNRDEIKFIMLSEPEHYWATANYIPREQVPEWALSRLNQKKQGIPDK